MCVKSFTETHYKPLVVESAKEKLALTNCLVEMPRQPGQEPPWSRSVCSSVETELPDISDGVNDHDLDEDAGNDEDNIPQAGLPRLPRDIHTIYRTEYFIISDNFQVSYVRIRLLERWGTVMKWHSSNSILEIAAQLGSAPVYWGCTA